MRIEPIGWDWFGADHAIDESALDELAQAAARCLRGADGQRLLAHLRAITIERHLAPECSGRTLRHLEGQRHLVAYLDSLRQRGRGLSPTQEDTT